MDGGIEEDLLAGVTPEPVRIDWERVEAWLGTPLPAVYRDLCDRFGSLFVGGWLWIHAPVSLAGYPSFDRQLAGIRFEARDACDASGLPAPVFHPKRGGLLPFGSGRGGEGLFWDTTGDDPDAWPVVALVHARGAYGNAGWVHSGLPLVPFLEALGTTGILGEHGWRLGPMRVVVDRAYGGAPASFWTPPDRAAKGDPRRKGLTGGSGLKALQVLVPPPEAPGVPTSDVAAGELPGDFTALMEVYGPGIWRDWLRVRTPGNGAVVALRPTPWGDDFLAFADSIDGDVLGWVRRGDPDRWPLAWIPRHADLGPAMQLNFTTALLNWLRGTPADSVFAPADPDLDLVDQATFEPYDAR